MAVAIEVRIAGNKFLVRVNDAAQPESAIHNTPRATGAGQRKYHMPKIF
jgi:hypothetical protein